MLDDEGPSQSDVDRFGSETTTCPECREDVYEDAGVCPNCGHVFDPPTGPPTWAIWVAAFLATVIVVMWVLA